MDLDRELESEFKTVVQVLSGLDLEYKRRFKCRFSNALKCKQTSKKIIKR